MKINSRPATAEARQIIIDLLQALEGALVRTNRDLTDTATFLDDAAAHAVIDTALKNYEMFPQSVALARELVESRLQ